MKKNHLTKLLISAAMLMVGLAAQAQVYTEFNMTGKQSAGVQYTPQGVDLNRMDKHQYGHMNVYTPKQQFKSPKKAESGEVTLTFNLVYDPDEFMPPYYGVTIVNDNYLNSAYCMGEDVVTTTVPPGTYDFVVQYSSMSKNDQYFVIREQVEVTEDATFTLSAEEATNHISYVNYGPGGNVLKHALLGGYDEETGEPIILEEGDIDVTSITSAVYLRGVGSLISNSGSINGPCSEELRTAPFFECYVNDVSDRYVFTQSRICTKGTNVWYLSYFTTDDVHVGVVENNPEDYVLCHESYQYTPKGRAEIGYGAGMTIHQIHNGYFSASSGFIRTMIKPKQDDTYSIDIYNGIPFENPVYESLKLLAKTEFVDNWGLVQTPWGDEDYDIKGKTMASPYTFENGQQVYQNLGHFGDYAIGGKAAVVAGDAFMFRALPAPSAFTYAAEQRLGTVGDNCPINAVNISSFYDEYMGDYMDFSNNFMGRYGESRIYDNADLTQTIKFNGEEIEDVYSRDGKGVWEITVTNNNIAVDGLPGENKTVIYYDETNEESTFPSIEMLQFKSDAGITDRFTTAGEGVMEFMGGDFRYTYYPELWDGAYDKCQSMDVTVEYSPYGEENWKELPIEEVPELYQDGWGNFYRASLANVNGKATQGWFDLRFKLKNEAGNWQEQVVSPAFRIDDQVMSAVEDVDIATDATVVARYSVDGRAISAPQPGLNIVKMSNGTSKKIWVK